MARTHQSHCRVHSSAVAHGAGALCLLEMTAPSLLDYASELVALGVKEINLFPLFLGVGRHAREDLPEQAQALKEKHPGVALKVMPSAGEIPEVVAFLAQTALKGVEL